MVPCQPQTFGRYSGLLTTSMHSELRRNRVSEQCRGCGQRMFGHRDIHTPLGRNIGVYRLEGSLVCHSIEAPESAQFWHSAFPAISKPLTAGRAGLAAKRPNETTYAKTYYSARLDKGVSTRFGMLFRLLPPPRKRAELNGNAEAGQRIVQNSSKPN